MIFVQEWTEAEIRRLLKLRKQGLTSSQIGRILGRSRNAVGGQIWRLREAGRKVPDALYRPLGGRLRIRAPRLKHPKANMWDMTEDQRRIAIWLRASSAASQAMQAVSASSPTTIESSQNDVQISCGADGG